MDKLSLRLPSDDLADLEAWADDNDLARGSAARNLIQSALETERGPSEDDRIQSVREEYEARIAGLETELERARRARRAANDRAEDIGELATVREREQSLAERRARAGFGTKLKWALFGMDDE